MSSCTFSGNTAVCRAETQFPFTLAVLHLGDGNDRGRVITTAPDPISIGNWPLERGEIWGDAGNDTLIGSAENDWLDGGPGADDIRGGLGLWDYAGYADGDQTTGVKVNLDDLANDGHPGEHDNIHTDVEFVGGTEYGNNVLIGDNSDNALFGGQGNDILLGEGGNDQLYGGTDPGAGGTNTLDGGTGLDTFFGGDGPDTIKARDSLPDQRITCNGGADVVYADSSDKPDADCETIHRG